MYKWVLRLHRFGRRVNIGTLESSMSLRYMSQFRTQHDPILPRSKHAVHVVYVRYTTTAAAAKKGYGRKLGARAPLFTQVVMCPVLYSTSYRKR